jgi:uncharacterized protein (DUF2141 family)
VNRVFSVVRTDRRMQQRAVGALAAVVMLLGQGSTASAGDLKVTIAGVRSDAGTIMIGLYDTALGFDSAIKRSAEAGLLNDPGRLAGVAMRAAGCHSIVFPDLRPGRYAVIAFHDENDNGRLDENAWGVPTEGYGFSNDAHGFLAAPSFDAAAVTLGDETASEITVSLAYSKTALRTARPAIE